VKNVLTTHVNVYRTSYVTIDSQSTFARHAKLPSGNNDHNKTVRCSGVSNGLRSTQVR